MSRKNTYKKGFSKKLISAIVILILAAGGYITLGTDGGSDDFGSLGGIESVESPLTEIPEYNGQPYVIVNDNQTYFTDEERENLFSVGYENYHGLDSLGRCVLAEACVGRETMPLEGEERGSIGMVKPSGWHTVKYDCVNGKYLYNRSHLIGWQLTTENANELNLITGTRSFNVDGMLPFEDQVADYVKSTENHVMYRVTPIFDGDNLVASGVLMEAKSYEDNGESLHFCVYVFNVQEGVVIDYATGESWLEE